MWSSSLRKEVAFGDTRDSASNIDNRPISAPWPPYSAVVATCIRAAYRKS